MIKRGPESFVLEVGGKQDKFPIIGSNPTSARRILSRLLSSLLCTAELQTVRSLGALLPSLQLRLLFSTFETDFPVIGSLPEQPARTPHAHSCKPKRGHWTKLFWSETSNSSGNTICSAMLIFLYMISSWPFVFEISFVLYLFIKITIILAKIFNYLFS